MILFSVNKKELIKKRIKYLCENETWPLEVAEVIAREELKDSCGVVDLLSTDDEVEDFTIELIDPDYDEYTYYTIEGFNKMAGTNFSSLKDFEESELYQNEDFSGHPNEVIENLKHHEFVSVTENYIITK